MIKMHVSQGEPSQALVVVCHIVIPCSNSVKTSSQITNTIHGGQWGFSRAHQYHEVVCLAPWLGCGEAAAELP